MERVLTSGFEKGQAQRIQAEREHAHGYVHREYLRMLQELRDKLALPENTGKYVCNERFFDIEDLGDAIMAGPFLNREATRNAKILIDAGTTMVNKDAIAELHALMCADVEFSRMVCSMMRNNPSYVDDLVKDLPRAQAIIDAGNALMERVTEKRVIH